MVNQKGGVGKTTTAVNLAAGLGFGGLSVLLVDLDPQGNASTAVGGEHRNEEPGTYEVLIEQENIADHVQVSEEAPNLKVLVATMDLAGAEIELVSVVSRETRLKRAIDAYLADNDVDYVIIDCPPSLGILTINAFVAAAELLIPIQCEYYALEGLTQLQRSISMVKANINPSLVLSTVLLTMYDGRTRLSSDVAEQVKQYFPEETMETIIPRSVRIAEAPSYGQTVITYQPASAGGQAYLAAAEELARRGAEQD
ncbi:AAA family ATPase [Raineyella sp. LH-20]|uniref:ParA family protein n=1 Tax=Raineyella sp. LH-20 TaxID=3081204 RepID=UPI00295323F4|nr:AAA family ATPase [Raineyella sp. LH-20]WOP19591.1 AAA family ATPase [Raineyella sp. LH-20]